MPALFDVPRTTGRFSPLRSGRFALMLAVAFCISHLPLNPVTAQDETEADAEPAFPVLAVNVASVDRIMDNIGFVFDSAEHPEIMDLINAGLANFRDLKGLDRTRPGGLMIFLSEGLAPLPIPVAYIPVEDIGELGQTLASVGAQLKATPGEEDRYELIPRRGPSSFVSVQNGYAFIGQNEQSIDQTFASPDAFAGPLSKRYDICVSANLRHVSKSVRDLLLLTVKNSAQASMQRRDNEPEAVHAFRKSQAESNLRFVENVLRDGEELTLGFKVDQTQQNAGLELVVKAKPDSVFAKELAEGVARPSYFDAAIDETVPMSVSLSALVAKHDRKTMMDLFNLGEQEVSRGLAGLPGDTVPEDIPENQSVNDLFAALKATIEEGHLDGFAQFFGDPEEKFVLIGGVRVINASQFGAGLSDILKQASKTSGDIDVELSVDSHGDIVFHRLTGRDSNKRDQRLFGETPSLYFGTDNQALWFAIGGKDAIPTLRTAIDRVAAGESTPRRRELAPFQFVMNMSEWVKLRSGNQDQPRPFAALALQAFEAEGSDVLRADARLIENGFRMRLQVENGFLKLLGMAIAQRIDRNQNL